MEANPFVRWGARYHRVLFGVTAVAWVSAQVLVYLSYNEHNDGERVASMVLFGVVFTSLICGVLGLAANMSLRNRVFAEQLAELSRRHALELDARTRSAVMQIDAVAKDNEAKIEALLLTMRITCEALGVNPQAAVNGDSLPPGSRKPHLRVERGGRG